MPVQRSPAHIHGVRRDDTMSDKEQYAATYQFGKTTVYVVAPPPMTEEEKEEVLRRIHAVGWSIIESLAEKGEKV
jgi:hypothetical protein